MLSLIGGAVFGGIGAVVGAISATTSNITNKVEKENFLVINYINSKQQFSSLIFGTASLRSDINTLLKQLTMI